MRTYIATKKNNKCKRKIERKKKCRETRRETKNGNTRLSVVKYMSLVCNLTKTAQTNKAVNLFGSNIINKVIKINASAV